MFHFYPGCTIDGLSLECLIDPEPELFAVIEGNANANANANTNANTDANANANTDANGSANAMDNGNVNAHNAANPMHRVNRQQSTDVIGSIEAHVGGGTGRNEDNL